MLDTTTFMQVAVHKAAIPLMKGESINTFTSALDKAAREHVGRKLKVAKDKDYMWPVEMFGDLVVYSLSKYEGSSHSQSYHAAKYERMEDGKFKFEPTFEVQRVTSYEPKQVLVSKMMWVPVEDVEKAVWTAAFINDLPDAAFAVILPGGKKDDGGKTVPRSLRMLPHHGANVKNGAENGSVDLVHLRNALSRLPQAKMLASAAATAKAHLEAHAKELLGKGAKKKLAIGKVAKDFWGSSV